MTATTCTIATNNGVVVCGRESVLVDPSVKHAPCAQHERAYRRHLARKGFLPRAWSFRTLVVTW